MLYFCFRMEESSRGLLQHKQKAEQLKQEKTALTLSYEVNIFLVRVTVRRVKSNLFFHNLGKMSKSTKNQFI